MDAIAKRPLLGKAPLWFWGAGIMGSTWNIYGVKQFLGSVTASEGHLMSMGMTAAQAEIYANLPLWMTVVFAVGVLGGLAGSVLLVARRRLAIAVLSLSLAGYIALYVGDVILGVFAAFGAPQVAILTLVIVIAAILLSASVYAHRRAIIR